MDNFTRLFILAIVGVAVGFVLLIAFVVVPDKREQQRVREEQRKWCTERGYDNAKITERHGSGKNSYTLDQVLCMDKDRHLIMPE